MAKKTKRQEAWISIRVPYPQFNRIKEEAKEKDRSLNWIINEIINKWYA